MTSRLDRLQALYGTKTCNGHEYIMLQKFACDLDYNLAIIAHGVRTDENPNRYGERTVYELTFRNGAITAKAVDVERLN